MKINSLGPIDTARGRFCGKQCGRGCTKKEYNRAVKAGYRLARRMGRGWTYRVWENLGWHYKIISPGKIVTIYPSGFASCDVGGHQLATVDGKTPEEASALILTKMITLRDTLTRALKKEGA